MASKKVRVSPRIDIVETDDGNGKRIITSKRKKTKSMPPRTEEEGQRILDMLWQRSRPLALCCEMQSHTGLRYSDCSWLSVNDFMRNGEYVESFNIIQQKVYRMLLGRRNRAIPDGEGTRAKKITDEEAKRKATITIYTNDRILEIVENARHLNPKTEWLFANPRSGGVPMTNQASDYHHRAVAKELKLPYTLGSHSWRKMFANRLIKKNATIEQIRDLLGHSSVEVTNLYLMSFNSDLQKIIKANQ